MAACIAQTLVVLLASVASAAPITSQEVLVRTAAGPGVSSKSALADATATIAFGPDGSLHVVKAHLNDEVPAAVSSSDATATAASVLAVHSSAGATARVVNTGVAPTARFATGFAQSQTASALTVAVQGGLAGMAAAFLQVLCLMWVRTAMSHQYYHGDSFANSVRSLWAEGGFPRFYQGIGFALLQAPMARFGDTFAQSIVVIIMGMPGHTMHGFGAGLIVATIGACWRFCVAPLDTLKTTSQVHGASSGKIFARRIREGGMLEFWSGASAMFLVVWVGSVPWWAVYNTVMEHWPAPHTATLHMVRNGLAGMLAGMVSDLSTNWLRVLKVKRQAAEEGSIGTEGYFADAKDVISKDGIMGLFFRGMFVRMLAGAVQGAFFSVMWNLLLGQMPISGVAHPHAQMTNE